MAKSHETSFGGGDAPDYEDELRQLGILDHNKTLDDFLDEHGFDVRGAATTPVRPRRTIEAQGAKTGMIRATKL